MLSVSVTLPFRRAASAALVAGVATLGACASGGSSSGGDTPTPRASSTVPSPDPRVGLSAGLYDAGTALWNMRLTSTTPSPEGFAGVTNSDLAFTGNYAIQGNYNGFVVWDISNPSRPVVTKSFL